MRCKKIDRFVLNPGAISGRDLIDNKIHKHQIHLKIIAFIDSGDKKNHCQVPILNICLVYRGSNHCTDFNINVQLSLHK